MNDISPELKLEWIIRALGIAGFTEDTEYPGLYAQVNGNIKTVVDLTAGVSAYLYDRDKKQKLINDDDGTLDKLLDMIAEAEDGRMPSKTEPDIIVNTKARDGESEQPNEPIDPEIKQHIEDTKSLSDDDPAKVTAEMVNMPQALTPSVPSDLSVPTIKKYINDKATDEEAYVFLQLCKARGLNPFVGDAYLIKYNHTKPATMVVGKDAFLKRAESHVQYDGFEAGIILESGDDYKVVDERDGTFYSKDEKENIVGGWAKVYRKDQTHPVVAKVAYSEYVGINGQTGRPNKTWDSKPATMIRKVALVQALREAFPSELSGMYDQSEMGVEVSQ